MGKIKLIYRYQEEDKGWYSCYCNQYSGIITQGESWQDLIHNAVEATEGVLECLSDMGSPLPESATEAINPDREFTLTVERATLLVTPESKRLALQQAVSA